MWDAQVNFLVIIWGCEFVNWAEIASVSYVLDTEALGLEDRQSSHFRGTYALLLAKK